MEGLSKITFLFADGKIEPSLELSSPSSQGACLVLEGFGASGGVRRNLLQPQRWGSPWQAGVGETESPTRPEQGGGHLRRPALPTPYPVAFSQMLPVGSGVSCGQQAGGQSM